MAKVGLVTVLYNSNQMLEGFFKSLSVQVFKDYHLYIIDNTPSLNTDKCLCELSRQYPISGFSHIKSLENSGIAKGNNIGIKYALDDKCEFILLLNNDIEFSQNDLLQSMIATADAQNESFITPKIYAFDTNRIWMAGAHFQWWKAMAYHIGENEKDDSEYDKERYCNFAPACFLLVRSKVFEEIGMIDEKYFVYFEDTDFLYRASQNGLKIFYSPKLEIWHKVSNSTGGSGSNFSIYHGNRNRIYFIRKHFGIVKKTVAYFFVFSSRVIKYINYDINQRKALLQAMKDGFAMKLD